MTVFDVKISLTNLSASQVPSRSSCLTISRRADYWEMATKSPTPLASDGDLYYICKTIGCGK